MITASSLSAASTETLGALTLASNTASIIRSDYGGVAGQALTFTASSGSVLNRNLGATLNLGQTCLAVRRAFVHRSKYDAFVEALRPLAAGVRTEPLVLLGQATRAELLKLASWSLSPPR